MASRAVPRLLLVLQQRRVSALVGAFAGAGPVRAQSSSSSSPATLALRSEGAWQDIVSSITPAHCGAMTRRQKLAVLSVCRLDAAFKTNVPPAVFSMIVQSCVSEDGGLTTWPPADLASLLIAVRTGGLDVQHKDVAYAVKLAEAALLQQDLSVLPLSVVADVFQSFLSGIATASPAAAALAGELSRRAAGMAARRSGGPAEAAVVAVSEERTRLDAVQVGAAPDVVPARLPQSARPAPELVQSESQTGTAERKWAPQPYTGGFPEALPLPLAEGSLRKLSTLDDVVHVVEQAVVAALQADAAVAARAAAAAPHAFALSSAQAAAAAASIVRSQRSIDGLRLMVVAELLRRGAAVAGGGAARGEEEQARSQMGMSAGVVVSGSGGEGGGKGGSGGGNYRRNDWRRRAVDGTMVAAGVGALLTVGAVVTGLQAAQVPAPSHRLVSLLEKASPSTFLHIMRYIAGPFPSVDEQEAVSISALLQQDHKAQAGGGGQLPGPLGGVAAWLGLYRGGQGSPATPSGDPRVDAAHAAKRDADDSLATALFNASLRRTDSGAAVDRSEGRGGLPSQREKRGGRPSGERGGSSLDQAAATTVVAAARRALVRSGMEAFSPAQLTALCELVASDASPVHGLMDCAGSLSSTAPPTAFWEVVLRAARSRPVEAYTREQRVVLAYRFALVVRLAGARYASHAADFASTARGLLAGLVEGGGEGGGEDSVVRMLTATPSLLPRLAYAAGVLDTSSPRLAHVLAAALSSLSAPGGGAPSPILASLPIQALWNVLLTYEKAVGPGEGGERVFPSAAAYPGGSAACVAAAIHTRTAAETASTSPLLVLHLLTKRPQAAEGTLSLWHHFPPSYVDGLWSAVVAAVQDASLASSAVPALGAAGVPRPPEVLSATMLARHVGGKAGGGSSRVREIVGRRDGTERAAAELRDVPTAQSVDAAAASQSSAVRALFLNRAEDLLFAATSELRAGIETPPSARKAIAALSEHLLHEASGGTGAASATTSGARRSPNHAVFTLSSLCGAIQSIAQEVQASSAGGHTTGAAKTSSDALLRVSYGRLLTVLSRHVAASGLADLQPLPPAISSPVLHDRGGADAFPAQKGRAQRDALAPSGVPISRLPTTVTGAHLGALSILWARLLQADASLRDLQEHTPQTSHTVDPLGLSWSPVAVSRLRQSLTLCCANIASDVAHRLAAQPSSQEDDSPGAVLTARMDALSELGKHAVVAERLASCVRLSRDLEPVSSHPFTGGVCAAGGVDSLSDDIAAHSDALGQARSVGPGPDELSEERGAALLVDLAAIASRLEEQARVGGGAEGAHVHAHARKAVQAAATASVNPALGVAVSTQSARRVEALAGGELLLNQAVVNGRRAAVSMAIGGVGTPS